MRNIFYTNRLMAIARLVIVQLMSLKVQRNSDSYRSTYFFKNSFAVFNFFTLFSKKEQIEQRHTNVRSSWFTKKLQGNLSSLLVASLWSFLTFK